MRPTGIEPGPTDSESYVLTTPPSMHMALTCDQAQTHANDSCIFKCNTDNNKKKKTQRRKLNSAPSAGVTTNFPNTLNIPSFPSSNTINADLWKLPEYLDNNLLLCKSIGAL